MESVFPTVHYRKQFLLSILMYYQYHRAKILLFSLFKQHSGGVGLNKGVTAGIVIAVLLVVAAGIGGVVFYMRRNKKGPWKPVPGGH